MKMTLEILENLINEGETLRPTIFRRTIEHPLKQDKRYYRSSEKDRYQNWQSLVQRFIKTHYPSELEGLEESLKKINFDNHRKMVSVLRAIKELPNEPETLTNDKNNSTNNIQITANQSVSQQMTGNVFLDAVKNELKDQDIKALKEILKEYDKEPEKMKNKVVEKIKDFGSDVLSNIVANILINPSIYGGF